MRTRTELPYQMIRRLREEAGLGLRETARKAHISPSFLSDLELGKRSPSSETLAKLSAILLTKGDSLAKAYKRVKLAALEAEVRRLRRATR